MKNFVKWFGIIAFIAVIGVLLIACDEDNLDENDELDGTTWKAIQTIQGYTATNTLTFNSPNFTSKTSYIVNGTEQGDTMTGTYTISGSDVTLTFYNKNPVTGETITAKGKLSGSKLEINGLTYTKQ
jgi:hypothetical protein